MTKNLPEPIVLPTKYNQEEASELDTIIKRDVASESQTYLSDYPTVYIIDHPGPNQKPQYTVYVGETNNIQRRTLQHLDSDPIVRQDWRQLKHTSNATMFIIGHRHFNKSLTLDIENRMMHYLSGVSTVIRLNNRRDNAQKDYYTAKEMVPIFNKIWRKLHKIKPDLFPLQRIVEDSALFKASPFYKLNAEQLRAKDHILNVVQEYLNTGKKNQLILVKGEAGAGKTVLMSNIFYALANLKSGERPLSLAMMVNQNEQQKVYEQIVKKLAIPNAKVEKVVTFIRKHHPLAENSESKNAVDIAFVDEAHLLLTQNNQAFTKKYGNNELLDIIKRAKVTIAVYDDHQVLGYNQIIENDDQKEIQQYHPYTITLRNQMRIHASAAMINWLRNIVDNQTITKAPQDKNYDLRIFDHPAAMQEAINKKANEDGKNGISRMIATFDWDYSSQSKNNDDPDGLWQVSAGNWHMPWNKQLSPAKNDKRQISGVKYSDLSWAEQPHTVREIGSTYTVQGFDLNYAGVVIGPSVKYRNGKIVFDPSESKDKKVYQRRSMHDGSKQEYGTTLIENTFNVLMTRGVNGLYLYAVDPALQAALKKAIR